MDFSLIQPQARHPFLRDITALKPWIYYVIMVVDPILRFSWIFYAIFTHNTQHSTVVSFATSLAEVTRRGLWAIIRVENEHCSNVAQYKASRDTPLPYELKKSLSPPPALSRIAETSSQRADSNDDLPAALASPTQTAHSTGTDAASPILGRIAPASPGQLDKGAAANTGGPSVAGTSSAPGGTFRRRYTEIISKKSILHIMAEAHKQDFEKKRPPPEGTKVPGEEEDYGEDELRSEEEGEDEDEDDDGSGSLQEERMQIREAETLIKRARGEGDGDDDAWV